MLVSFEDFNFMWAWHRVHRCFSLQPNYYARLAVPPSASPQQIKHAYLALAKQHHPDLHPGHEHLFKDIAQAYRILSDPQTRKDYDLRTRLWTPGQPHPTEHPADSPDNPYSPHDQPVPPEETLQQLRRMEAEYLQKHLKCGKSDRFERKKTAYDRWELDELRRYHAALHMRRDPRPPQSPDHYNEQFDRSKDSLSHWAGQLLRAARQRWRDFRRGK